MTHPSYLYPRRFGISNVTLVNPPNTYAYLICLANLPGVVAANTFLSLVNPTGSGKVVYGEGTTVSNFAVAATTVTNALTIARITGHSSGVDSSASIVAMDPNGPTSIVQARTSNPTVTGTGPTITAISPPIQQGTNSNTVVYQFQTPVKRFVIPPGFGIRYNTAAGDTDQQWNISATWTEVPEAIVPV